MFGFTVFRLLENAFMKLPPSRHDLIISPRCKTTHKLAPKNLPPHKKAFLVKHPPTLGGGRTP